MKTLETPIGVPCITCLPCCPEFDVQFDVQFGGIRPPGCHPDERRTGPFSPSAASEEPTGGTSARLPPRVPWRWSKATVALSWPPTSCLLIQRDRLSFSGTPVRGYMFRPIKPPRGSSSSAGRPAIRGRGATDNQGQSEAESAGWPAGSRLPVSLKTHSCKILQNSALAGTRRKSFQLNGDEVLGRDNDRVVINCPCFLKGISPV